MKGEQLSGPDQIDQYQRGQILGFTMAEIVLVLLFLLLIILGMRINKQAEALQKSFTEGTPEHSSAEIIKSTTNDLISQGILPEEKDMVWLTEALVLNADKVLAGLDPEEIDAKRELATLKKKLSDMEKKLATTTEDLLESKLEAERFKQEAASARSRSQKHSDLADILDDKNLSLGEAKSCLLSCGGGPKACWGESLSNPDFIYNVALFDDSVWVSPDSESIDSNQEDWSLLPSLARISQPTLLGKNEFMRAFSQLKEHATRNECVFQARLVDLDTSNKEKYKSQKRLVDGYVYSTIFKNWKYGDLPEQHSDAISEEPMR